MRATVSREMLLENVFVPDDGELLPPGVFGGLYLSSGHGPLMFSATFLGLMQQAYDFTIAYLLGEADGAPAKAAISPEKGHAVANMLFKIEAARALFYRSISEAKLTLNGEIMQRARAAHVTIQRAVVEVTQEALRVCGGPRHVKALSTGALRARRPCRSGDAALDAGHRHGGSVETGAQDAGV